MGVGRWVGGWVGCGADNVIGRVLKLVSVETCIVAGMICEEGRINGVFFRLTYLSGVGL